MRNRLKQLWTGVASWNFAARFAVKAAVFGIVVVFTLYPDPVLLLQQVRHFNNAESLLSTDFEGIEAINTALDSLWASARSPLEKVMAVEQFVYRHIRYQQDWYSWGVMDYWPPVEEVWRQKSEDCDGRAILAASILRARGYPAAELVGNLNHMWVRVGDIEIMGPRPDKSFSADADGAQIALPSLEALFRGYASLFGGFPALRILIIYLTALLLVFHPRYSLSALAALSAAGTAGLFLLKDWAGLFLRSYVDSLTPTFAIGTLLLFASLLLAARQPRNKSVV